MVKYDIYTYDKMSDSLFLAFPVEYNFKEVIPLEEEILLEIDQEGLPRALEILNASTIFNTSKENLSNIRKVEMMIDVSERFIKIDVSLTLLNVTEPVKVSESISNMSGVPLTDESLAVSL